MWENLGRVFGEFPHIYRISDEEFFRRIHINGAENLEFLKNSPVSGIFFSAHMGNWEISPRIPITHGIKTALIYRPANNQYTDKIINKERMRDNIKFIPKGAEGAKLVINSIKQRVTLAMLVDQKMNDGIEVPFFGINSMTAPAIARLALKYGCPVVPTQVIREKGAYFTVNIFPPLIINQNDDITKIMKNINEIMEKWIREKPSQWFWVHKRWPKP
jgi:KDO2-lipid IV(A) lauroyltransferase